MAYVFFLLVWKATLENWCNFRNLSDCSTCYNTCLYPLSHYNQIAVDYFTKKSHHHVLQFQGYGLHCDFYLLVPSLLHLFCFSLLSKLLNLLEFFCFLFSYSSMWLQNCTVIVACGGLQNKSLFTSEIVYIASFLARFKKKKKHSKNTNDSMSYQRVIIVFHFMILSIRITEKSKQTRRQQRSEIER